MRRSNLGKRVQDWELILARIRTFGFEVHDYNGDTVIVDRYGRECYVDLVGDVRIGAKDPRDVWLLQRAVEDRGQWEARETYFIGRSTDFATMPVELRLGFRSYEDRTLFLDHDMLDGRNHRTTIDRFEALADALPVLGPPNSVGYHRARERIIACFEKLRPKRWDEVGISDSATIAEYERYQVTADDVAHARAGGRETMNEIISNYGIPPLDRWVDVQPASDHDDDH